MRWHLCRLTCQILTLHFDFLHQRASAETRDGREETAMSKFARILVSALLGFGAVAAPAVLGADTAVARDGFWCC